MYRNLSSFSIRLPEGSRNSGFLNYYEWLFRINAHRRRYTHKRAHNSVRLSWTVFTAKRAASMTFNRFRFHKRRRLVQSQQWLLN